MSQINFNAPWDPLQSAWVGASYGAEFYEPIKDHKIRDSLQKIAHETKEDYKGLIATLESFNITVSCPHIDPEINIMNYVNDRGQINYANSNSFTLIPRPPMQPRDSLLVVGSTLIESNNELNWFADNLKALNLDPNKIKRNTGMAFDAPLVTVIGQHLIVDCCEHTWLADYIQELVPDRIVVPVHIGGHNDAVFCPVRPGLIVSSYHHTNYTDTFPGWEVKFIETQSWNAIPEWRKFKHNNATKWWIPDKDNNPEFANFVDTWLGHWLGYVEETVFDVNMLQINPSTILVNNYNKEMFDFFKTKNIEPIITPFRHRFFWDGGIHCITNDLYREGDNNVYITR
jgi:hypothetical protein